MGTRTRQTTYRRLILLRARLLRLGAPVFRIGGGLALVLAALTVTSADPIPASTAQLNPTLKTYTAAAPPPGNLVGGRTVTIGPGTTVHVPKSTGSASPLTSSAHQQTTRRIARRSALSASTVA